MGEIINEPARDLLMRKAKRVVAVEIKTQLPTGRLAKESQMVAGLNPLYELSADAVEVAIRAVGCSKELLQEWLEFGETHAKDLAKFTGRTSDGFTILDDVAAVAN